MTDSFEDDNKIIGGKESEIKTIEKGLGSAGTLDDKDNGLCRA